MSDEDCTNIRVAQEKLEKMPDLKVTIGYSPNSHKELFRLIQVSIHTNVLTPGLPATQTGKPPQRAYQ